MDCTKTSCKFCPFHGNCLQEKKMLKIIEDLRIIDKLKYDLALINQSKQTPSPHI